VFILKKHFEQNFVHLKANSHNIFMQQTITFSNATILKKI